MTFLSQDYVATPAVVVRPPRGPSDPGQYLILTPMGAAHWTADPRAATAFESMREATRAALRLPGAVRAFGLPLHAELGACSLH